MTTTALVGIGGPTAGQRFDLGEGYRVVGRSRDSGLYLSDPGVSRRHAGLTVQGRRTWVEDLGSTEGTFINGEPVLGRRELHGGDVLQFAQVALRVDDGEPAAPTRHTPAPTRHTPAAARYDVGDQYANGSINNVAGNQIQYVLQQRDSILREVAVTKTRGRRLMVLGFLLVACGFALFANGALHFLSTVLHSIESQSFEPPTGLLGPEVFGVPVSLIGWAIAMLGIFLMIVGLITHIVATARRRRVDRELPVPRPYG